jgi:hypothetical protein
MCRHPPRVQTEGRLRCAATTTGEHHEVFHAAAALHVDTAKFIGFELFFAAFTIRVMASEAF